MKVFIDSDEAYPVYGIQTDVDPEDEDYFQCGIACELSEMDILFIKSAEMKYAEAQGILRAAYLKASGLRK